MLSELLLFVKWTYIFQVIDINETTNEERYMQASKKHFKVYFNSTIICIDCTQELGKFPFTMYDLMKNDRKRRNFWLF